MLNEVIPEQNLDSSNQELRTYRSFNKQINLGETIILDHNDLCPENVVSANNEVINATNLPDHSHMIVENAIVGVIDESIGDAYFLTYVSYI